MTSITLYFWTYLSLKLQSSIANATLIVYRVFKLDGCKNWSLGFSSLIGLPHLSKWYEHPPIVQVRIMDNIFDSYSILPISKDYQCDLHQFCHHLNPGQQHLCQDYNSLPTVLFPQMPQDPFFHIITMVIFLNINLLLLMLCFKSSNSFLLHFFKSLVYYCFWEGLEWSALYSYLWLPFVQLTLVIIVLAMKFSDFSFKRAL